MIYYQRDSAVKVAQHSVCVINQIEVMQCQIGNRFCISGRKMPVAIIIAAQDADRLFFMDSHLAQDAELRKFIGQY